MYSVGIAKWWRSASICTVGNVYQLHSCKGSHIKWFKNISPRCNITCIYFTSLQIFWEPKICLACNKVNDGCCKPGNMSHHKKIFYTDFLLPLSLSFYLRNGLKNKLFNFIFHFRHYLILYETLIKSLSSWIKNRRRHFLNFNKVLPAVFCWHDRRCMQFAITACMVKRVTNYLLQQHHKLFEPC